MTKKSTSCVSHQVWRGARLDERDGDFDVTEYRPQTWALVREAVEIERLRDDLRIPDVINAPPGFITVDRLPRISYRPHPLGDYVV